MRTDQATADALAATLALARTADELGYHRYWLAEHHNMPAVAATNPPVLVGLVASATARMRVGSGGVMLPNHAPLVVAEQFALLEAAYPGRIDLGHRPGTRHRPGHVVRAAPRRRRSHRRGGLPVPGVRRQHPGDDGAVRRRAERGRPHPRPEGDAGRPDRPHDLAARLLRLLGPTRRREGDALRLRPPLLRVRHRRGARALPLHVPAVARAGRAADLPHGQRRGRRVRRGGRAARAAQPLDDGRAAHRCPARPAAPGRGGREGSTCPTRTAR